MISKDKAPDHDIDLGAPRVLEAHSEITLPQGDRAELPSAVHVDRPYTSFNKTYRFEEGRIISDRIVVVKQHKLAKEQWKDYLAFSKEAALEDGESYAVLLSPVEQSGNEAPTTPATLSSADLETASAQELRDRAEQAERQNDWAKARRYLEAENRRFPHEPYALSMLAYIDYHDRRYDAAVAGYKAELAAHPDDDDSIVRLLAGVYMIQKRYGDAVQALESSKSRSSLAVQEQLIGVQTVAGNFDAALSTVREALAAYPANKTLQSEEARVLLKLHRPEEAAQAAKRSLEGNEEPNLLNGAAYYLAKANSDLPLAESSSRRSVEMFDRTNSTGAVEEANTRAFALSYQMIAAWDTLGYILLVEGRAKAAEPYLAASWFEVPAIATGNHLSEAYEKLGRRGDARLISEMTLSLEHTSLDDDDRAAVESRSERLKKAGVAMPSGRPLTLQASRTFQIKNTSNAQGSGIVRVQLAAAGIIDSTLVSGEASLKPLLVELQHVNLPAAVPPASPAHVLRDAALFCGKDTQGCELVFLDHSGIGYETTPGR